MQEPHFIKCEPGLSAEVEETTNGVPNLLLPTDVDMLTEIKVEPCHVFADENFDEAGTSTVKEEYEIQKMATVETLEDEEVAVLVDDYPSETDTPVEDSETDDDDILHQQSELCSSVASIISNNSSQPQSVPASSFINISNSNRNSEEEEEEEEDDDYYDDEETAAPSLQRNWRKRPVKTTVPIFSLQQGPVQHMFRDKATCSDVFLTFLSDDILDKIVFQTNLYCQQKQRRMMPITREEMYGFIGLQFLFGYHRLPHLTNYWSQDVDYSVAIVPQTMPRERFRQILSNLHVSDNSSFSLNNTDELYKIRPLITDLNDKFRKCRLPNQCQSISESMVLFGGHSTLKQNNPVKPVKRGYKLWCRSDMSGYIYEFSVYEEKSHSSEDSKRRCGLGRSVVETMTRQLRGKNHIVFMDKYFTSVELFEYLRTLQIYACGTVCSNRNGLPTLCDDKDLKRGEFDYRVTDHGLSFFKWKDKRCVHLLSNYHGTEVTNVDRTQKDGSKLEIEAPIAVVDYYKEMGGVSKGDMLRSFYDRDRKAMKWWHRLFFAFLEIALVNAFVVYCELNSQISLLQFKRQVTQGLLTIARVQRKRGRPWETEEAANVLPPSLRRKGRFSVSNDIRFQNRGAHWPVFVASRRRCEFCASNKIQSKPHSKCSLCNVHLCLNEKKNCFYDFHNAEHQVV